MGPFNESVNNDLNGIILNARYQVPTFWQLNNKIYYDFLPRAV